MRMTNSMKTLLSDNSVLEAGHWVMVTPMVADTSFPPISVTGTMVEICRYKMNFTLVLDPF